MVCVFLLASFAFGGTWAFVFPDIFLNKLNNGGGDVLWSSGTTGPFSVAILQGDGNFVVYGIWNGLTGEAKYKIQASNNGMDWDDYPLFLPVENVTVLEREIVGASGTSAIKINNWFPDYLRVVYTANTATAGDITFLLTMINLQDVS